MPIETRVSSESKAMAPGPQNTIKRWLMLPVEYFQIYGAFFLFGGGGVLFTIISAILYPILPRDIGIRFGRAMMCRLFRFYLFLISGLGTVKIDLSALDKLDLKLPEQRLDI